jgi:hypothetical protein
VALCAKRKWLFRPLRIARTLVSFIPSGGCRSKYIKGTKTMATFGHVKLCAIAAVALLSSQSGLGWAQAVATTKHDAPDNSLARDGQHDFDFLFGRWKVHLKRKVPGTDRWTESDGYGIYRKVWGGRANLNEFFTESPNVEGLTLRTYNGATHLWSLYWANSRDGILSSAQVGKFDHGQGEFYAQDNSDGKGTLLRYIWSKITPTSAHFEQAFSENGGRSWKVNWISDMVRIGDTEDATSSGAGTVDEQPGQRDFEPLLGRWRFHLKARPALSGSTQWVDYTGPGECTPLWHGRAQLDTINLDGPTKHIEGLTVRLFNPKTHEWRLYWANSRDGLVVVPQIGQYKAGHGEFYAQDVLDDKSVLVKFDWSALMSKSPHFEQSFSNDGGKNWEVNWISDQTRVN